MLNQYEKLTQIAQGLNNKYPKGNEPFQIITRLCEEAGEIAKAVNHLEGSGIKKEKYGEPDRDHLAKEVLDLLGCALHLVQYYNLENSFEAATDKRYQKLKSNGFIN